MSRTAGRLLFWTVFRQIPETLRQSCAEPILIVDQGRCWSTYQSGTPGVKFPFADQNATRHGLTTRLPELLATEKNNLK